VEYVPLVVAQNLWYGTLCEMCSIVIISFIPTHTHNHTPQKHHFTLILKTHKNIFKNLALHVSVHIYDHLQGVYEQCFMPLLS